MNVNIKPQSDGISCISLINYNLGFVFSLTVGLLVFLTVCLYLVSVIPDLRNERGYLTIRRKQDEQSKIIN